MPALPDAMIGHDPSLPFLLDRHLDPPLVDRRETEVPRERHSNLLMLQRDLHLGVLQHSDLPPLDPEILVATGISLLTR